MGRQRTPCCEKTGLRRGPWSPAEDEKLISFIQQHGHENWRALPKLAGLLRCGKSCRLRWVNYLRPDVKRGNLTKEEEETIINLHAVLGNKWSKIASKMPGRTDNEIKNVWNTHLKKRLAAKEPKAASENETKESSTPSYSSSSSSCYASSADSSSSSSAAQVVPQDPSTPVFNQGKQEQQQQQLLLTMGMDEESKYEEMGMDEETKYEEMAMDEESKYEEMAMDEESKYEEMAMDEESKYEDQRRWLAYLESELGLHEQQSLEEDGDEQAEMMVPELDPVDIYFQMWPPSPPHNLV